MKEIKAELERDVTRRQDGRFLRLERTLLGEEGPGAMAKKDESAKRKTNGIRERQRAHGGDRFLSD
ncbi:MAG: hypothetical protein L0338_34135 [Acidobacteria bacterium]|nr:hypothetical protein [Acidobacteriota bacterium]